MATKSTNKTTYWIIGAIVGLAVIGFGGYKVWHHFMGTTAMSYNSSATGDQNYMQNNTSGSSGLPNKSDTSNQQLDQDVQNVQNSLNQLQQDQNTSNHDTTNQSQDTPQQ